MTSGMALFGLFAVDDLARIAVKKLAQHQETKAIADSIAHDFKDMGVAFAAAGGSSGCHPDFNACTDCAFHYGEEQKNIQQAYNKCQVDSIFFNFDSAVCETNRSTSMNNALYEYNQCTACHC